MDGVGGAEYGVGWAGLGMEWGGWGWVWGVCGSEDEAAVIEAEDFEERFNFRFEQPGAAAIVSHARQAPPAPRPRQATGGGKGDSRPRVARASRLSPSLEAGADARPALAQASPTPHAAQRRDRP